MNKDNAYTCDDADLGRELYRLFGEGNEEVTVRHPVDGDVVVTKKEYFAHLAHMEKVKNMSPADTLVEKRRLKNIKKQMQMKLRKAMVTAPVHTVDFDDESSFGFDVDGNKLDVEGMMFVCVGDYPRGGIDILQNEQGAFIDEKQDREPIRLIAAQTPSGEGMAP